MKGVCLEYECLSAGRQCGRKEQRGPEIGQDTMNLWSKRYDPIFNALPDALVITDSTGKIVQVNAEMEKLFGYSREALIGNGLEMLMPKRFRERQRRNVSSYVANPRCRPMGSELELFGLRKDGTEFPVDISLSHAMIDDVFLAIASIRDITEYKAAQRKRLVLKAFYEALL